MRLIAFFLILCASISACANLGQTSEINFYGMGTPMRVVVNGKDAALLAQQAKQEILRLEKLFNRFDENSEISKLNNRKSLQLSKDTKEIIKLSQKMKVLTNGAFNVQYGGKIDLGGIAKGYAADKARALLMKSGAKSGMIDMASSIAVFGPRTWKIAIKHPRQNGQYLKTIELKDGQSLSTSGDYERGKHIIDPKTKKPAMLCQAVTIVGTSAAQCDALSTAVFVLGPVQGAKLLDGYNFIIVDGKGIIYDNFGSKLR